MNQTIQFSTDCASLFLFDREVALAEGLFGSDVWIEDFMNLPAVKKGELVLLGLGGDGTYCLRITDGELTADERDYATVKLENLGLRVTSGSLSITGDGFSESDLKIEVQPGEYDLSLYLISYHLSSKFWRSDHSVADDAPADIVAILQKRTQEFSASTENLQLIENISQTNSLEDRFLFPSETRCVGTQAGMILESKVVKTLFGIVLDNCGMEYFPAKLTGGKGLKKNDQVRFKVLSVDRDKKVIHGEFVEKLTSA